MYEVLRAVFPEIDGVSSGMNALLDKFYDDWGSLAEVANKAETETDPALKLQYQADVESAKRTIYQDAVGIVNYFNSKSSTLTNMQIELNKDLRVTIEYINQYLKQIYEFNKQISNIYTTGQNPNDILDKRNEAMNKLAGLINYDFVTKSDGTVVLLLSGFTLVNGGTGYNKLTTMGSTRDSKLEDVGILMAGSITPTKITDIITGGQLGGILNVRDDTLQWYKVQLDNLANSMITVINNIHRTGVNASGLQSNTDFFIGDRAANIAVNPQLISGANITYKHFKTNDIADIIANLKNKIINNWIGTDTTNFTPNTTLARNGEIIINGIKIYYYSNETIRDLINKINTNVSELSAIFDERTGKINIYSNQLMVVEEYEPGGTIKAVNQNGVPPLISRFKFYEEKLSAGPVNYFGSILKNTIDETIPWQNQELMFNFIPSNGGEVVVDYQNKSYPVRWYFTDTPRGTYLRIRAFDIANQIDNVYFDPLNQKFVFREPPVAGNTINPYVLSDRRGNVIQVMNITENIKFGEYYATIVGRLEGELETSRNIMAQHEAALQLYQQLQNNITKVNEDEELARARAYQRAYDASVRLLSIIDQMMNMLINRTATPSDRWE
jgi:flagellar hook-associated protein FlgK